MKKLLLFAVFILAFTMLPRPAHANYYWNMITGQLAFKSGKYQAAVNKFQEALKDKPDDPAAQYNLGTSYLKMKKYNEAENFLSRALDSKDQSLQAKSEYNLGELSFNNQKLQEALKHYIKSLDLNPDDMDTKYNIQVVQKLLKQQQKNQDKNKDKQKQKNKDQDKNKDKQKDKDKQKEKDKNKNKDKQQQEKPKQQQQKQQKDQLSKDDVERLLRYYEQKEKQEKSKKQFRVTSPPKTEEDW